MEKVGISKEVWLIYSLWTFTDVQNYIFGHLGALSTERLKSWNTLPLSIISSTDSLELEPLCTVYWNHCPVTQLNDHTPRTGFHSQMQNVFFIIALRIKVCLWKVWLNTISFWLVGVKTSQNIWPWGCWTWRECLIYHCVPASWRRVQRTRASGLAFISEKLHLSIGTNVWNE